MTVTELAYALQEFIKANPKYAHIPVCILDPCENFLIATNFDIRGEEDGHKDFYIFTQDEDDYYDEHGEEE